MLYVLYRYNLRHCNCACIFVVVCRYDVYASLEAQAAYLKLNANGIYLLELQAAFADLQVSLNILSMQWHSIWTCPTCPATNVV